MGVTKLVILWNNKTDNQIGPHNTVIKTAKDKSIEQLVRDWAESNSRSLDDIIIHEVKIVAEG